VAEVAEEALLQVIEVSVQYFNGIQDFSLIFQEVEVVLAVVVGVAVSFVVLLQ
jgi:hypothetical protein